MIENKPAVHPIQTDLESAQKEMAHLFVTERANMWKELQRLEEELKRQNFILKRILDAWEEK